jgi:thiamine biosynthesis lipoprotein
MIYLSRLGKRTRATVSGGVLSLLAALFLSGCSEPVPALNRISGQTMGSQYHISWYGGEQTPSEVHEVVEDRLNHLLSVFSTYDPQSELSTINRYAADLVDKKIAVSGDLMSVLRDAEHVSRYSIGRLDVTVGPLVNLWGFGPEPHDIVPSKVEVQALLDDIGMTKLSLSPETLEIEMTSPLYIDLSSVAKGWSVDDIGLLLEAMEITNYLVEIGGEVRVRGKKPEADWKIAIERPVMELGQPAQTIIAPGDMAVATSGDYRNYFEKDGQRYSHTIDPLTGYPVKHALTSVTVIMPTCSMADAWATALNVAGPDAGMALAEANDLPVYMIIRDGDGFREETSSTFARNFSNNQP